MVGWLLICAGMLVLYGLATVVQTWQRDKRIRRDNEEWLRRYSQRTGKGDGWWQ